MYVFEALFVFSPLSDEPGRIQEGRGSCQLPLEELNRGDSSIIVLGSGIPEVPTYWGRGGCV